MTTPCTCPKRANDRGAIECVGLDVFCPMHCRPPPSGCAGCQSRDLLIAELELKLKAFESIVQTPGGKT